MEKQEITLTAKQQKQQAKRQARESFTRILFSQKNKTLLFVSKFLFFDFIDFNVVLFQELSL